MYKVKFADIGEGLTEGKVAEVLVKLGQNIKEGDSLFFVETDKVNSEIPAPVSGVVAQILIKPGQEIKVGEIVMEIDDGAKNAVETPKTEIAPQPAEENASVVGSTPVSNDLIASRVQKSIVQQASALVKATPLARKIAAQRNIDLTNVTPSGPHGRILVKDLDSTPAVQVNQQKPPLTSQFKTVVAPDAPLSWDTVPMNGIRKATVKAMTKSHEQNAAFTGMKNIDISATYNFRAQLKDATEKQGIKLTYLAFIIKAAAKAIQEMPNINVRIDEANSAILEIHNINIGVAVDTPKGLMVPVIKGADQLSVFDIAVKINELAIKARDGKLAMNEMKDATFTVSNFGSVGLDYATPIINSPESAILGVGTMTKQPTYKGEEIVPAWIMPFSMTCDHRIIDGGDAGRFLLKIENYLKNPILLLM